VRRSSGEVRRVMFRLTLCLLLLLPGLARLAAADPESLSRKIAADWQALQARTKTLTPEERIAAVDAWQKAEQPKLEEWKQAKFKPVRASQIIFRSQKTPVTELDRLNAVIEKEFQPIRDAKLSPEERIRQMDVAMKKTEPWQTKQKQLLQEQATTASRSPSKSSVMENTTPEARLAEKSRKIFEQTKNMTPEERIAALDARKDELEAISREIRTARTGTSTNPIHQKSTTPKPIR